jgi:hypothetical protein
MEWEAERGLRLVSIKPIQGRYFMNIRRNARGIIAMTVTVLVLTGLMCTLPSMSIAAPIEIKLTTVQLKSQQMGIGIDRFSKYATELLKDKVRIRTIPVRRKSRR